jgi:hypothetical protein
MKRMILASVLEAVVSGLLFGQAQSTATMYGTVTDPTEAVVPGAKVTVTSPTTGSSREVLTDSHGDYRIGLLPPGVYEAKVEREGFSTQVRKDVELTVGQIQVVSFRLSVGTSAQLIEVQADVPIVETERSQQADLIGKEEITNLPINRRDYLTFTLLAPGVNDSKAMADSNSFRVKQTPDSGLSFYGSNGRGNHISVDGGEVLDSGGGVRPTVSQEAVQEFQINRANYAAELPGARGGVVNIVTKSGSNDFMGSAFGFFRHQSLDATDPFAIVLQDLKLTRIKPDSNRQQFGGTFGGPVVKDRTFFFLSYEQLRRREFRTVPVLTDPSIFRPTPEQEQVLGTLPAFIAGPLRIALSSPPSTISMFTRNSGVFPFQTDDYKGLFRLDHRINDANQVAFRYNISDIFDTNEGVGALIGYSRGYVQNFIDHNALGSWTHVHSASLVNEARAQFSYYGPYAATNDPYGPALEIAGYGFFNRDRFLPSSIINRRTELVDNLSITRGDHSFKLGAYVNLRNNHTDSKTFMSGRFTFGSLPGGLLHPALAVTNITALQAFNLGLAQSYQQGFGDGVVKMTHPLYAGYAQDTWKVKRNFTLNYGLRYELDTRKQPMNTSTTNFAPRIGLAWDPFKTGKTSVRAGYGFFYAPLDTQVDYVVNALGEIGGYRQIAQVLSVLRAENPNAISGPINIFRTLRDQGVIGIPTPQQSIEEADLRQFGIRIDHTGPRPPLTVLFRNVPDYRNPLAQQASFGIEREIVRDLSFGASYVFVRGAHLTTSLDGNLLAAPVNPATGIRDWGATPSNPTGFAYFRDPLLFQDNVYESGANSFFHGLIVESTKRFGRNAAIVFNYTFSKAIDETTDYNSDFQPNDQTSRRAERALSSFDQRHKVVLYSVLQSPESNGPAGWLKSNWLFTPIFRYNSPRPFNLLAGTELNNDRHNTTDRPYYAGRNTGIGPSFWTFDARVSRRIRFDERRALELMAEFFNLFNKLNYTSVNNTVGNMPGPFNVTGRHDRTAVEPLGFTSAAEMRRIQLGVRFRF